MCAAPPPDNPHGEWMHDHWWWRPGWRLGRSAYTFHVTFEDDAAVEGSADLRRLVTGYQQALAAFPGLDLVPPRWLHLTMQNVGFTDEVSESDIRAVLAEVARTCAGLRPFDLVLDQAEVRREAIALRPHPAEPVAQVRDAVRAAIGGVLAEVPEAPEHARGFQPHVSLAYSNATAPAHPYVEAIQSVDAAPASITVRAARLIVLDRDERVYRWRTYGTVPLGSGRQDG